MTTDKTKNSTEADSNLDLATVPLEEPEDGVFAAYANIVNLDWTLYDIRIRFAELIQVPDGESSTWANQHTAMLERVMVTLPWHQAKNLCHLLATVIENYEAVNGELKPIRLASSLPVKKSS
ncbi:hypothetical protein SBA6_230007 [Candidatus Sulfopaludibacter sp. SbA6]|nr:hypothetical protein SBA6_230007 [Candidatus Sulfopaludibacter sp. SbA6]